MTIEQASALVQETIRISLWISGPILATAMLSGLLISILQAATQINEQTLSFVPKIVLTMVVFAVLFPWMMASLVDFGGQIFLRVASGGAP